MARRGAALKPEGPTELLDAPVSSSDYFGTHRCVWRGATRRVSVSPVFWFWKVQQIVINDIFKTPYHEDG
jgi:hypothetical protein